MTGIEMSTASKNFLFYKNVIEEFGDPRDLAARSQEKSSDRLNQYLIDGIRTANQLHVPMCLAYVQTITQHSAKSKIERRSYL
jgi:hypothetical protein